jgi:hypothetical protein
MREISRERGDQLQLVLDGQLDIDTLDGIRVFAQAFQGDDDVLVDLEGIGVFRDSRRLRAVQPEFLARFTVDCDETLARACVGKTHDFRGGSPDDIAEQYHLGQCAPFGLRAVADGAQVAFVQVLEARQNRALRFATGLEVALDLHDGRDGIARLPEEFEAHRADVLGHAMEYPACCGDETVAAFFLNARKSPEELIRDVLAKPRLAELRSLDGEPLSAQRLGGIGMRATVLPLEIETGHQHVVDLAHIMIQARHLEPIAIGIHHAPPGEVVDGRAP